MNSVNRNTVVAVFDQYPQAKVAVDRLWHAGFAHTEVGIAGPGEKMHEAQTAEGEVEDTAAKGAVTGAIAGGGVGAVAGALATGLIPGVGPVVAGGLLLGLITGAAAGAAGGTFIGPFVAGLDKFVHFLVNWDQYLAPAVRQMLPFDGHTFMLAVGVIEIAAGLLVALRPRIGAYVVMAWLWGIIINLLLAANFYDVALRDFGLSLGALALARLSVEYDKGSMLPH